MHSSLKLEGLTKKKIMHWPEKTEIFSQNIMAGAQTTNNPHPPKKTAMFEWNLIYT